MSSQLLYQVFRVAGYRLVKTEVEERITRMNQIVHSSCW